MIIKITKKKDTIAAWLCFLRNWKENTVLIFTSLIKATQWTRRTAGNIRNIRKYSLRIFIFQSYTWSTLWTMSVICLHNDLKRTSEISWKQFNLSSTSNYMKEGLQVFNCYWRYIHSVFTLKAISNHSKRSFDVMSCGIYATSSHPHGVWNFYTSCAAKIFKFFHVGRRFSRGRVNSNSSFGDAGIQIQVSILLTAHVCVIPYLLFRLSPHSTVSYCWTANSVNSVCIDESWKHVVISEGVGLFWK